MIRGRGGKSLLLERRMKYFLYLVNEKPRVCVVHEFTLFTYFSFYTLPLFGPYHWNLFWSPKGKFLYHPHIVLDSGGVLRF